MTRVEVSADDGSTWWDARVDAPESRHAWQRFVTEWSPTPGEHLLRVRAHDESGRCQPTVPVWNRGGFGNNADLPVRVVVPG